MPRTQKRCYNCPCRAAEKSSLHHRANAEQTINGGGMRSSLWVQRISPSESQMTEAVLPAFRARPGVQLKKAVPNSRRPDCVVLFGLGRREHSNRFPADVLGTNSPTAMKTDFRLINSFTNGPGHQERCAGSKRAMPITTAFLFIGADARQGLEFDLRKAAAL